MSDIIKLLPDHIANQIAAGEVVQRPASVVKELLENALDAGAQNIRLIVKDAGKTLIQVMDDGIGMSETDARLSFERHATSKISIAEDLFSIRTMGFRGEALASIAAVAQVELKTKKHHADIGCLIQIEGSRIILQEPCQTSSGTSISVKNLFYNIPARRNFLKSDQVEFRHIIDEFQQIALAHPSVFFSLHHNGEKVFHLPAANLRQRIVAVFGAKSNEQIIPVSEETELIKIYGFIGKPEFAKKQRGEQYFFVNNRFIKSHYLHHALMMAYEDLLAPKMYPFYVVFLEIDPSKIDVNVHPTKQEIKFEDDKIIYNYLRVSARHAIAQYSLSPTLDFESDPDILQHFEKKEQFPKVYNTENQSFESKISSYFPEKERTTQNFQNKQTESKFNFERKEKSETEVSNLKNWEKLYGGLTSENNAGHSENETENFEKDLIISKNPHENQILDSSESMFDENTYQLNNSFIVLFSRSGILLIDQQAAHQRIMFEKYLNSFKNNQTLVQHQLFPQTISLPAKDAVLLRDICGELNILGIDIKDFGNNSFVIHGLPAELKDANVHFLVQELIEQIQLGNALKLNIHENIARALALKNTIKSGKKLTKTEMQNLVDELFRCQMPNYSPSGKKIIVKIEMLEILRKFE